ncbi:hypothetical protein V9L05_08630 [Bernardetia sp. Wsw4-3y2]|uniref:hypothetical protein n=1 Tax=Bernardetia sp. Wsw4-3y2 TaxID=3127471 RepID=UPI0030CCDEB4
MKNFTTLLLVSIGTAAVAKGVYDIIELIALTKELKTKELEALRRGQYSVQVDEVTGQRTIYFYQHSN